MECRVLCLGQRHACDLGFISCLSVELVKYFDSPQGYVIQKGVMNTQGCWLTFYWLAQWREQLENICFMKYFATFS